MFLLFDIHYNSQQQMPTALNSFFIVIYSFTIYSYRIFSTTLPTVKQINRTFAVRVTFLKTGPFSHQPRLCIMPSHFTKSPSRVQLLRKVLLEQRIFSSCVYITAFLYRTLILPLFLDALTESSNLLSCLFIKLLVILQLSKNV